MGNFIHLARSAVEKVSCFLPLERETGNFATKNGNSKGNIFDEKSHLIQADCEVSQETFEKTSGKPNTKTLETIASKITPESFLSQARDSSLLEHFFNKVGATLGIELLPDDVRWIKTVCYGLNNNRLKILLEAYISNWVKAMFNELVIYKKQNVGRFTANTYLRESLIKK